MGTQLLDKFKGSGELIFDVDYFSGSLVSKVGGYIPTQFGTPQLSRKGESSFATTTTNYLQYTTFVIPTTALTVIVRATKNAQSGWFIDDGKLKIGHRGSSERLIAYNDGATFASSAVNSFLTGQTKTVVFTRNGAAPSLFNIYVDGIISGTANQSGGNITAGTNTPFAVRQDPGIQMLIKIIQKECTAQEVAQLTAEINSISYPTAVYEIRPPDYPTIKDGTPSFSLCCGSTTDQVNGVTPTTATAVERKKDTQMADYLQFTRASSSKLDYGIQTKNQLNAEFEWDGDVYFDTDAVGQVTEIVKIGDSDTGVCWGLRKTATEKFQFIYGNELTVDFSYSVPSLGPLHIVLRREWVTGTTYDVKLWVNGSYKEKVTGSYSGGYPADVTTLQFGGTGNDQIHDVKVLSSGDYAVCGYTTSTSLDGNANPNAASSFVAVIDKNLPVSGFIKQIRFEDAAGDLRIAGQHSGWIGSSPRGRICIDPSDNIYYVYGITGTFGFLTIRKLPATDFSAVTSLVMTDRMLYGTCQLQVYGGFLWIGATLQFSGNWAVGVTKLTMAPLAKVSSTRASAGAESWGDGFADMVITSNGIFIVGFASITPTIIKMNFTPAYVTKSSALDSTYFKPESYNLRLNANTDYVYVVGSDRRDLLADTDVKISIAAYNQSDLGAKAGFTRYTKTPTGGKTQHSWGFYVDDSYAYISGLTNDGATGTFDGFVIKVSAVDGSYSSMDFLKYNSGSVVGQALKTYAIQAPMALYNSGKYIIVGYTDGNLTGFVNAGSNDCFLIKTDAAGKILSSISATVSAKTYIGYSGNISNTNFLSGRIYYSNIYPHLRPVEKFQRDPFSKNLMLGWGIRANNTVNTVERDTDSVVRVVSGGATFKVNSGFGQTGKLQKYLQTMAAGATFYLRGIDNADGLTLFYRTTGTLAWTQGTGASGVTVAADGLFTMPATTELLWSELGGQCGIIKENQ